VQVARRPAGEHQAVVREAGPHEQRSATGSDGAPARRDGSRVEATTRRPFAVFGEPIRTSWLTAMTVCTMDARPASGPGRPTATPGTRPDAYLSSPSGEGCRQSVVADAVQERPDLGRRPRRYRWSRGGRGAWRVRGVGWVPDEPSPSGPRPGTPDARSCARSATVRGDNPPHRWTACRPPAVAHTGR
jgi:hypothetical protein